MTGLAINQTRPTDMAPIAMWIFEGDNGEIICEAQHPCRRPNTDLMACHGCPVAWRIKDGQTEYYRTPVSVQVSA